MRDGGAMCAKRRQCGGVSHDGLWMSQVVKAVGGAVPVLVDGGAPTCSRRWRAGGHGELNRTDML
jgi:hypothetical protein